MGAHHAITGAAAWVAITASAPYLTTGIDPLGPVGVFTGTLVCAGAALLPDIDHPNSTISHSIPGVGSAFAKVVETTSGGHRHGVHSLLAAGVALAGSLLVNLIVVRTAHFGAIQIGAGLSTMALIAFALKALKLTRGGFLLPWFVGALVAAGILLWSPQQIAWLPIAVTVGFVVHLLGDGLTVEGVPFLWPWIPKPPRWWGDAPILGSIWKRNGYMSLPILGRTGSVQEWLLCVAVSVYVFYTLTYEALWAFGIQMGHLF